MDDLLLTLSVPAVVLASGMYAVCDCRRQRRRPPPYTRRAARLAARDALALAESVVDSAYAALGGFYTGPAARVPGVSCGTEPSRGPGPSWPAPARRA